MSHYNSYRRYLTSRFGEPVLKIPLNGGFSCPNRDGTKSESGCAFCDNGAFSPVAAACRSPLDQLTAAISETSARHRLFLPYLQPFSNTYGSPEQLRGMYEPLLTVPGVVGLAVGTRPDCFTEDIYSYLGDVAHRTYLSLELGLQSAHESTLEKNKRGHTYGDFADAVMRLSAEGIETVAHVMLGLADETREMIIDTARRLASLPVTGVKIHQLMIIRGTAYEKWYQAGSARALDISEYAELLAEFISWLRPDQHIHRIMADSRPELGLIAPSWSGAKARSLAFIHEYMDRQGTCQGSRYSMKAVGAGSGISIA